MLKITIEHIPDDPSQPSRVIGVAEIAETGDLGRETDGALSSHVIRIFKTGTRSKEVWKHTIVDRFPGRSRGAWDLLFIGLRSLFGARNGESYRQTSFEFNAPPHEESLVVETVNPQDNAKAA